MGIYFHVHAGPVLVCKYHMEEVVTKTTVTVNACSNPSCSKKDLDKAKFCSQCGGPVVELNKVKEKRKLEKSITHIYDLMIEGGFSEDTFDDCWGGTNNEEFIDSSDLLSPNSDEFDKLLGRETTFEANTFALHLRGAPDVAGEIAKCETWYAKEIEFLRTKYDSVTVEWAVLTTGK